MQNLETTRVTPGGADRRPKAKMSTFSCRLAAVLFILCAASPAKGGDGNSFLPKKISIDLESPFLGDKEFKFQKATVVIIFGPDEKGNIPSEMHYARPDSLKIHLGKDTLVIPPEILTDIRRLSFSEMRFFWFAHQYVLSFDAQWRGDRYREMRFFWKDGKLIRFKFNNADMSEFYPLSLPKTPPSP